MLLLACTTAESGGRGDGIQFNRDIRPLLAENCFQCHGPDAGTREAELRLDTQDGLFGELASGERAIVPGNPDAGEVYRRITASDPDERMPPADSNKSLSAEEVDLLRRWIEDGAEWQGHWAFLPPVRVTPPDIEGDAWSRNAVDQFVLSRLRSQELQPSPAADRVTLIRRLSFDLTGMPPGLDQVDEFLQDEGPSAYDRLVDRLLASPHYGERMAMHWLDLVRFADSGGYHSDNEHSISPYRDYVIDAFNENRPFDRFTREQLAGDLLPNPTMEMRIATGYNRLNKTTEEGGAQPGEYLAKSAADRVRTTSGTWLGLTLGCAECHDHKYDPLTTRDFYSFVAFFADVQERGVYSGGGRAPEMAVPTPSQLAEIELIEAEIANLEQSLSAVGDPLTLEEALDLQSQTAALTSEKQNVEKQFTNTMITVSTEPREIHILPRGNWLDTSGEVVGPALPSSLGNSGDGGRRLTRLDLADWLIAADNPLTGRVFVNRLWKLFFGTGLSKQLDDLGTQGEWPTHPELLDWLAVEFQDSGWDVKHMVRLLVTSSTYRQSSRTSELLAQMDPLNRLCARQSRWRLDAEMIRDNALRVSGLLADRIGGRSVKPYQPAGYWSHLNFPTRRWKADTGANQYRRGLYTHWQRTFLHPSLLAFDAPSREECTAERAVSNTPKAALTLLNDPTYVEAARAFAERVFREAGSDDRSRIDWAWRACVSRPPLDREVALLTDLLQSSREDFDEDEQRARELLSVGLHATDPKHDPIELAAWTSLARAVFNLNEFITRN